MSDLTNTPVRVRAGSKRYLGDGAYVEYDGFGLVLTAEDGIRATNTVYLEPEVLAELERFVAELRAALRSAEPNNPRF